MKLHLIDGTYELFRAHFSKRPGHTDPRGRDRKATVGVAWSLLALLAEREEEATHVAIAFDNPIRSFRNDMFHGYKTEAGVPAELLEQFDPVEEAARAVGVTVWSMDRWEADDALATASWRWRAEVDQVRILTPDKDLGQCLEGDRVVQVDRVRRRVINEAALMEAKGIAPASVPDWLALVGDTADGIPGIPGFGEKTSATLLRAYGSIDRIPERAKDWSVQVRGADALAATLNDRRDDARLYKELATLARDVPLPESLDDLRWRGVPREKFDAWCAAIGASDGLREQAAKVTPR